MVLSSPVSALVVSIFLVYLDLVDHVGALKQHFWGSRSSTFKGVSSLWHVEWPTNPNVLSQIVSMTLGKLPYNSWLFICWCQCIFRAIRSIPWCSIHWHFSLASWPRSTKIISPVSRSVRFKKLTYISRCIRCSLVFISGNFYFPFVSTLWVYITIPKTKEKQKLPHIKI